MLNLKQKKMISEKHIVVFDGTSHSVVPSTEFTSLMLSDENVEYVETFDEVDDAFDFVEELNKLL